MPQVRGVAPIDTFTLVITSLLLQRISVVPACDETLISECSGWNCRATRALNFLLSALEEITGLPKGFLTDNFASETRNL